MKTSELTGAQLDLWVARTLELEPIPGQPEGFFFWHDDTALHSGWFAPSTDWAPGGPLIHKFGVSIVCESLGVEYSASTYDMDDDCWTGSTELIATCRAIVASKYGDTVPDKAG
jgi:hypothetical protein